MLKKIIFSAFFLAICFIQSRLISAAHAQELALSISPPILEVLIKPGKSVTQVFTIINQGDDVIAIPKITKFAQTGIVQDPGFTREKWIQLINRDIFFDQPIVLKRGESRQLIVRINPDSDSKDEEIYRALIVETMPNPIGDTTSSSLSQIIGSPLIITLSSSGLLQKSARISRFELPVIVDSFEPIRLNIEVENTGKSYFRPIGKISFSGMIGGGSFDIEPNIILTGQRRKIATKESDSDSLQLAGFFLGKYRFGIDFALDQSVIKISQSKVIYAIPYKVMFVVLFACAIGYIIREKGKMRKKRQK